MPNMEPHKNPMPLLDIEERRTTYKEVALGYDSIAAINEAQRCLNCPAHPCTSACPVGINIPKFISYIAQGKTDDAYSVITMDSSLPAICGRVCPQESQCESMCVRGKKGEPVAIGRLERYAADNHSPAAFSKPQPNGHKVAVVGSGPSGLACAGDLAKLGYAVTIFEALHEAGGVLVYGIPEFRLPKRIVKEELEKLTQLGVEIRKDMVIGKVLSFEDLFADGYEAVFVGSGAGLPSFMGIPGESLVGVFSANEILTRINLMKAYREGSTTPVYPGKKVVVVGGGNVAMDAARSMLRLGADVTIVYRRGESELPARAEEVSHAKEEGVKFDLLRNPVEIIGDESGKVTAVRCIKMELGEPDESGRRRPHEVPGSEYNIEADCVVIAIGTKPNPLIKQAEPELRTTSRGVIEADENGKTSMDMVFAGGDAVTGSATVILAMGAGKKAAAAIHKAIMG